MADKRRAPQRSDPFSGLRPSDFIVKGSAPWPNARLSVPQSLKDGTLTQDGVTSHLLYVNDIQSLARDLDWFVRAKSTYAKVADATGVSIVAMRSLRNGKAFPTGRVYGVLRAYVPTDAQMRAGDFRDGLARVRPAKNLGQE